MKKVFIVHGWTYSLEKWTGLCDILRSKGVEPIQLRVPGLTEPSKEAWEIGGYVNWLDEKLGGEEKPVVIGHSNGGRIGLAYALKHPGRLGQLILIDSAGVPNNQEKSRAKLKVLKSVAKLGKPLGRIPLARKAFYKLIGARDYLEAPPNMRETMQNMLAADRTLDLEQIRLPVTIIWGRNDTVTPLADGQRMHQSIQGSEIYIVEDARHSPIATKPEEVADIILERLGL